MNTVLIKVAGHIKDGYEEYDSDSFKSCRNNLDSLLNIIYETTKTIPVIGDTLSVYPDDDLDCSKTPLFYKIVTRDFAKNPDGITLYVDFWLDDWTEESWSEG